MENKGIIKRYPALVDPSKIGFSNAIVGVDTSPEKFLEVAKKLTEFENVKSVATSTGDHMLMAGIWMENPSSLRDFISRGIENNRWRYQDLSRNNK